MYTCFPNAGTKIQKKSHICKFFSKKCIVLLHFFGFFLYLCAVILTTQTICAMKKLLYLILVLSLMTSCAEKPEVGSPDGRLLLSFRLTLYRDAPDADWQTNPYAYLIEERHVTASDTLLIPMAPGGGFAAELLPLNE